MTTPTPGQTVEHDAERYEQSPCPESHYWFASWVTRGYTVTCSRCGTSVKPWTPAEHEQGHR